MAELLSEIEIQKWLFNEKTYVKELWEELNYLRNRPLKKRKYKKQSKIDIPVATFSKKERLKDGMGMEITLILRSSACSWAKSKSGGCTMCGYWNDRASKDISGKNYWNQFEFALKKYDELLDKQALKIVFKIFTSGSFCDKNEIPLEIQLKILKKLSTFTNIKEIVLESRPEYITEDLMDQYKKILTDQYLEIGVGLETANDFIRRNIINKGFNKKSFLKAVDLLHKNNFGMKGYLLFKPPFVKEYTAIIDIYNSIRFCIKNGIDIISVNPTNIQQNTICDELDKMHSFRPPWLYSLLWVLKNSLSNEDLKNTRIICDPSAAGKSRGVHNCYYRDKSNTRCLKILRKFVETQDISEIPDVFKEECWNEFVYEVLLGNT